MNNLFIGSEGLLLCGFDKYRLLPEEKFRDVKKPGGLFPKSPGFYQEWVHACGAASRAPATSTTPAP